MSALLLLLPLLLAGAVLYLLYPRSGAGRGQVWVLTALVPLAMALAAAQYSQRQVAAHLQQIGEPRPAVVTVTTPAPGGQARTYRLKLTGEQAACFEQARRLSPQVQWRSKAGLVPLRETTQVTGELPPPEVAGQLSVLGRMNCHKWVKHD